MIAVKYNGLWGFINKQDKFIIVPQYKSTKGFIDDLAYVIDDNYEGYINKQGIYVWKQPKQIVQKATGTKSVNTQNKTQKNNTHVKNDLADSILNELGL